MPIQTAQLYFCKWEARMAGFFRRLLFIAVLPGEVICILGATAPARAQHAPAAAQMNRSEAVLSTSVGPSIAGASRDQMFAALLREIGAGQLAAREEAITGRKQPQVDWATVNRTTIGLSDQEWTTASAILLDGSRRVSEWSDQMQDALGWRDGRFQPDPAQRTARTAAFNKLSAQGDSIVEETVLKLRHQLGNDAFSKLDAYVSQREGGARSPDRGPIRKGPIETAQAAGIPNQK
jgi:hypothetical protein